MTYAAIAAVVVGAGASAVGSAEAKRAAERQATEAGNLGAVQRNLRDRAADTLDNIAQNILSGAPISPAETRIIDMAQKVATQEIERQRKITQENVLEAQAGAGFLTSGRTARQLRKLNVEAGESQQRIALAREQAIQQTIERKQATAIDILKANLGINVGPSPLVPQGLPTASLIGTGLTQIGGALFQQQAQQQSLQQQQAFLQSLQTQQGGTGGGVNIEGLSNEQLVL